MPHFKKQELSHGLSISYNEDAGIQRVIPLDTQVKLVKQAVKCAFVKVVTKKRNFLYVSYHGEPGVGDDKDRTRSYQRLAINIKIKEIITQHADLQAVVIAGDMNQSVFKPNSDSEVDTKFLKQTAVEFGLDLEGLQLILSNYQVSQKSIQKVCISCNVISNPQTANDDEALDDDSNTAVLVYSIRRNIANLFSKKDIDENIDAVIANIKVPTGFDDACASATVFGVRVTMQQNCGILGDTESGRIHLKMTLSFVGGAIVAAAAAVAFGFTLPVAIGVAAGAGVLATSTFYYTRGACVQSQAAGGIKKSLSSAPSQIVATPLNDGLNGADTKRQTETEDLSLRTPVRRNSFN